jgi:ATP-dependent helicase/nuclease subunit A
VLSRLEYAYPQLAAASIKASAAASGFDGDQDFLRDSQVHAPSVAEEDFTVPPSKYESPAPGPLHRGTVTHRFLQHLDLNRATESGGVARELERMVAERIIESEDHVLIDQTSLEWFASTPLADLMRSAGNTYRREFMFTSAESLGDFDHTVQMSGEDYVLVRGIVDGILPVAGGIEIVDFKTDAVDAGQVAQRAERYRSQMVLYAKAMARLWRAPVRACWLVFLAARQCYVWRDGAWESQAEELRR